MATSENETVGRYNPLAIALAGLAAAFLFGGMLSLLVMAFTGGDTPLVISTLCFALGALAFWIAMADRFAPAHHARPSAHRE